MDLKQLPSYHYPYYCTTLEAFSKASDAIAQQNGFVKTKRQPSGESTYHGICSKYSVGKLRLEISSMGANWYCDQDCFAFTGRMTRVGVGYVVDRMCGFEYRKCPSYFAKDVENTKISLMQFDDKGYLVGYLRAHVDETRFYNPHCYFYVPKLGGFDIDYKTLPIEMVEKFRIDSVVKFTLKKVRFGCPQEPCDVTLLKQ